MQDDAPKSAQFLGPIALSDTKTPLDAAYGFFLIARDGYDKEPYQCRTFVNFLLSDIENHRGVDEKWMQHIKSTALRIEDNTKDKKTFESL